MKCPNCGSELSDGANFCVVCGTSITAPDGSAPAAYPGMTAAGPGVLPQQPLQSGQTFAGPAAGAAFGVPETSAGSEEETRERAKARLATAKAAYKQARKDAGKSALPKVIGGVVAAVLTLGLGAGGMYAFLSQQHQEELQELQGQLDKANKEVKEKEDELKSYEVNDSLDDGDADATDDEDTTAYDLSEDEDSLERFVGTYTGTLTEPANNGGKKCYGAEKSPIKLDIKEIASSGRMTVDLAVMFHGHDTRYKNDQTSVTGDKYLTFEGITSSFDSSNNSFTFTVDGVDNDEDASLEVRAQPHETDSSTPSFDVTVTSESSSGRLTETYLVEKK